MFTFRYFIFHTFVKKSPNLNDCSTSLPFSTMPFFFCTVAPSAFNAPKKSWSSTHYEKSFLRKKNARTIFGFVFFIRCDPCTFRLNYIYIYVSVVRGKMWVVLPVIIKFEWYYLCCCCCCVSVLSDSIALYIDAFIFALKRTWLNSFIAR